MAYLHNGNGQDYEILGSRRCRANKKHKDYLVKEGKSGYVYIAECWQPKYKCWVQSRCYGDDKRALRLAKKEFYSKKR